MTACLCLLVLAASAVLGSLYCTNAEPTTKAWLLCVNGPLQGQKIEADEPRRGWYLFAQHGQHIYQSIDPWDGELEAEGWYCGPGAACDNTCLGR